ncbi:MAG TPA: GNAT family N-acetyltransferase [Armatimonadota bacterium]|nr:GNAT family N-acetyltransferase [Armatimonadota bacterium]
MSDARIIAYHPNMRAELVVHLNRAYADLRALRPVGIEPPAQDYPDFTDDWVRAREEQGAPIALICEGDEIAAAASWHRADHEGRCELAFIATSPERRRQGHAAMLLARCAEWARGEGLSHVRTWRFVDSRYAPARTLLEGCGYEVADPDQHSITMEVDINSWHPREPELPDGYRLVRYDASDEQDWMDLQGAVFGNELPPGWFTKRFAGQPNFDPNGWFFIERAGRKVGITGAIIWFWDEAMTRPSGALIEWVGVLPDERGRNLGEALVVAALNYLKGRNVYPNCLVTQPFRKAAIGLYEKLGYQTVREMAFYVKQL